MNKHTSTCNQRKSRPDNSSQNPKPKTHGWKTLVAMLLLIFSAVPQAKADTIMMASPWTDSLHIGPIETLYADWGFESEMIYPESMVAPLRGNYITGLTFYSMAASVDFDETFYLSYEVVSDSAYTFSSFHHSDALRQVWSGQITIRNGEWHIELDSVFYFPEEGQNLLLHIRCPGLNGGACSNVYFKHKLINHRALLTQLYGPNHLPQGNPYFPLAQTLPMMKVNYQPSGVASCPAVEAIAIADLQPTEATFTWNAVEDVVGYEWSLDGQNWTAVEGDSLVLTGLTAYQPYQLRLHSVCDTGVWSFPTSINFITPANCTLLTHNDLPFEEDFQNEAVNQWPVAFGNCMSLIETPEEDYQRSMVISQNADNKALALWGGSDSLPTILILPRMEQPASLTVEFDYSSFAWEHPQVEVGVMSADTDAATFTTLHSFAGPTTSGSWQHYNFPLENSSMAEGNIAIRVSGGNSRVLIDNIVVSVTPPCTVPTGVLLTEVDQYSATLVIESPNEAEGYHITIGDMEFDIQTDTISLDELLPSTTYLIEVQTRCHNGSLTEAYSYSFTTMDEPERCDAPTEVSVSNITNSAATISILSSLEVGHYWVRLNDGDSTEVWGDSIHLVGLDGGTDYVVSVRAICSDSLMSEPTTANFHTLCSGAISSLPWGENFDGVEGSLSSVDAGYTVNALLSCWNATGSGENRIARQSGNNRLLMSNSGNGYYMVVLPSMVNGLGDMELSLNLVPSRYDVGEFSVGYTLSESNVNAFTSVVEYTASDFVVGYQPTAHVENIALHDLPEGARIALRYHSTYYFRDGWYVDDIELRQAMLCDAPQGVRVQHIGQDTAVVAIRDSVEGQTYHVELTSEVDSLTFTIVDTIVTVRGLSAGMHYQIAVSALCEDSTLTTAIVSDFRTECAPLIRADLPYATDFEEYAYDYGAQIIDSCWRNYSVYTDGIVIGRSGAHIDHNDNLFTCAQSGSQALHVANHSFWVLPAVSDSLTDLQLSFGIRTAWGSSYNYHYWLVIGTMTDPLDPSTFVFYDSIQHVDSVYRTKVVDFSNCQSEGLYIALRNESDGGVMIDDLLLESTYIAMPTDLTAVAVDSMSATIEWQPGGNEEQWLIDLNGDTIRSDTNSLELSGLTPLTTYQVRVAAVAQSGKTSQWCEPIVFTTLDTTHTPVGIEESDASQDAQLLFYPNPANQEVVLQTNVSTWVELLDAQGRMAMKLPIKAGTTKLDIRSLPTGVYIVKFTADNQVTVRRIIIER